MNIMIRLAEAAIRCMPATEINTSETNSAPLDSNAFTRSHPEASARPATTKIRTPANAEK